MFPIRFKRSLIAVVALAVTTTTFPEAYAQTTNVCAQSGATVQFKRTVLSQKMDIAGGISLNDRVPLQSEGTQIMALDFKPKCANSNLLIESVVYASEEVNTVDNAITALFVGNAINASATGIAGMYGTTISVVPIILTHVIPSRNRNVKSLRLRAGADRGDPIHLNGGPTDQDGPGPSGTDPRGLGGTLRSYLQVTEMIP